jgi:phosphodiesterase/alkaline phosphatase D-like protein
MRTIETILQDVANNTTGCEHYGRGMKAYANIESEKYPRIWVHLVNPIDTIAMNSLVTTEYNVMGEVSALVDFTADVANDNDSTLTYLTTLETLQNIFYRFVTNLNKHPLNMRAIGKIQRKEFLHDYDDNLCGYAFSFTMQIKEPIPYQC